MSHLLTQLVRSVAVAALLLAGCSSQDTEPSTPGTEAPSDANAPTELAVFEGHWDGRDLTFRSLSDSSEGESAGGGIGTKNFQTLPYARLALATPASIVVNDGNAVPPPPSAARCLSLHDGTRYFGNASTPQPMVGGGTCTNKHLCANVTMTNTSPANGRTFDNLYIELSDMRPTAADGGFRADNSVSPVPTGYGLSTAAGLFGFGSLAPGETSTFQRMNFYLPDCRDFSFRATIKGTVRPTAYTVSALTALSASDPFQDACVGLGGARAFPGAIELPLLTAVSAPVPIPFPFTLYNQTYNDSTANTLVIGSTGVLGFQNDIAPLLATLAPRPLPAFRYTMYPFWDALTILTGNVCYATRGGSEATHDRTFVVTWKDANVLLNLDVERITFSVVLFESSDIIEFQYARWSNSVMGCNASGRSAGNGAYVGLQGDASTTLPVSQQVAFLPTSPAGAGCPTYGRKIRFTPNPAATVY